MPTKTKKIVERPVFCFDFGIFSFFPIFFCFRSFFFFLFFFFVMGWDGGAGQGVCVCVEFVCDRSPDIRNTADPRNKEKCFFFAVLGFFSFVSAERRKNRTTQPQQQNLVLPSFTEFSCVCVLFFLQFRASRGFRRGDLSVERLANERGVPFESPDHSFTDETIL